MSDILKKILATKADEIAARSRAVPLPELCGRADGVDRPRGFMAAMQAHIDASRPAVIAEGYWRPLPELMLVLNLTTRFWNASGPAGPSWARAPAHSRRSSPCEAFAPWRCASTGPKPTHRHWSSA